jgi:hypothetical protein
MDGHVPYTCKPLTLRRYSLEARGAVVCPSREGAPRGSAAALCQVVRAQRLRRAESGCSARAQTCLKVTTDGLRRLRLRLGD